MVILNRRLSKESFWKDGRTPTIWSYELENAKKSLDYRGNVFCTSSTSPHVNSTLFHLSHNQQPSGLDRSINTPHLIQDANSQQLTVFRPWNQGLRRCPGKPTTITQLEGVHTFLSSKDTNSMPARPLSPPHSPHVPKNDNNPASHVVVVLCFNSLLSHVLLANVATWLITKLAMSSSTFSLHHSPILQPYGTTFPRISHLESQLHKITITEMAHEFISQSSCCVKDSIHKGCSA